MALPVGQISLSEVNVELNQPATQLITMNDAAVRTLAGVGGAGTVISMADLQGKSNRVVIALTISANTDNYNIYTNRGPTYQPGLSDITLTINPGVFVGGGAPGAVALSLPSQFSPADTVTIINQGVVIGRGGSGGAGAAGTPKNGTNGTTAFDTQRPVTIQNQGTFAGGGGGGGGGNPGTVTTPGPPKGSPIVQPSGGGGGGGGAGIAAGTGGAYTPGFYSLEGQAGTPGTNAAGGAGGGSGGGTAQSGGAGGGRGVAGSSTPVGTGGNAGLYANGNPLITWQQTGTRQGSAA